MHSRDRARLNRRAGALDLASRASLELGCRGEDELSRAELRHPFLSLSGCARVAGADVHQLLPLHSLVCGVYSRAAHWPLRQGPFSYWLQHFLVTTSGADQPPGQSAHKPGRTHPCRGLLSDWLGSRPTRCSSTLYSQHDAIIVLR